MSLVAQAPVCLHTGLTKNSNIVKLRVTLEAAVYLYLSQYCFKVTNHLGLGIPRGAEESAKQAFCNSVLLVGHAAQHHTISLFRDKMPVQAFLMVEIVYPLAIL